MGRYTLSAGGTTLVEWNPAVQNVSIISLDADPRTAGITAYFQESASAVDTSSATCLALMPGMVINFRSTAAFNKMAFTSSGGSTFQILS